ncbi:MAG: response regulator [Campylobacterales bacterium]
MNDKILIIENDKKLAELIAQKLQTELEIETDIAYNFSEAKLFLKAYDYFLTLVDSNLPDAPNGEVIDYALSKEKKVIVLSGNTSREFKKEIIQKKIIDYISKNDNNDVSYIIHKVMRLQKNRNNTILVVDDSMVYRKQLQNMLENLFYKVITVAHGEEALGILEVKPEISLVVTDYNMPVMDGLELTSEIRKKYDKTDLAIIALSSNENEDINALFLKEGANDYIRKPFSKEEFSCRIDNTIEAIENIQIVMNHANRDFLTGLYNRRFFYQYMFEYEKEAKELGEHFSIAMIGIDKLDDIKVKYGTDIAQKVTIHISNILTSTTSYQDLVSIFSDETFCIILKNTNQETSLSIAQRLQNEVQKAVLLDNNREPINLSISIAVVYHQEDSIEDSLDNADMLLYKSKEQGINQLVY